MSDEKSQTFSEKLEEFETKNDLAGFNFANDTVKTYLAWTATEVAAATQEQLRAAIFTLSRYMLHLSDLASHHQTLADGAEKVYQRNISMYATGERGFTFEEKKANALVDYRDARELYDVYIEHHMKASRLRHVIYRLDDLTKKMEHFLRRT